MNKYKWSSSNNAFFSIDDIPSYIHAGWKLDDAIDVDDSVFIEYTKQAQEGFLRGSDEIGMPSWILAPEPTKNEMISFAVARIKSLIDEANEVIGRNQWPSKLSLGRLGDAGKLKFNAWLDYTEELEGLDAENAPNLVYPKRPDEDG